jgi:hypothetical protein
MGTAIIEGDGRVAATAGSGPTAGSAITAVAAECEQQTRPKQLSGTRCRRENFDFRRSASFFKKRKLIDA